MKPAGEVLSRADWVVDSIPLAMGQELVGAYHYSRGSSNTAVFRHGMFPTDNPLDCVGVALWLPPTRVAAESVDRDEWRNVLMLTRLVIAPHMPTNAASFLLARSIRLIKQAGRWTHLVTYADEGQGHTGAIYKATNWTYVGTNRGDPVYVDAHGRQVSRRRGGATLQKSQTHDDMLRAGHTRLPATRKHKFVMRLT